MIHCAADGDNLGNSSAMHVDPMREIIVLTSLHCMWILTELLKFLQRLVGSGLDLHCGPLKMFLAADVSFVRAETSYILLRFQQQQLC